MKTTKEIEVEIRAREKQREETAQRLGELYATRENLALAGTPKERGDVRKAIAAAEGDLEDDDLALELLAQQLAEAQERDRIAGLRADLAKIRREASELPQIDKRLEEIANERRLLLAKRNGIAIRVQDSYSISHALNEPKIPLPIFKEVRTEPTENEVLKVVREIREAAAAA